MNLKILASNEINILKKKVGNIEDFKLKYKTGPASRLDLYKDIDTTNKRIYVALKGGNDPYPEMTDKTIY